MTHHEWRFERVCRYISRPPIASERLSLTADGRVLYRLRATFRDGTSHFVFDPLTFIERIAALVPRPRTHQLTYHGVLAPAAGWRDLVVPRPPDPEPRTAALPPPSGSDGQYERSARRSSSRMLWADLLRRVFEVDVLACPCGGRRRMIAMITQPAPIRRILSHIGLPTSGPSLAPARPPPEPAFVF